MTTVGILGVTHDEELREKYRLPLSLIEELIVEFAPDVICGEVTPSTWDLICSGIAGEGYWKSQDTTYKAYWAEPSREYWELIFPYCEERELNFIPMDWLEMDVWRDFDCFAGFSKEERMKLEEDLSGWCEKQFSICDQSAIPFNSFALDHITKDKYEWLASINPDVHQVHWVCRHLIMVQRIRNAITKFQGKRILCIAGADHNPYLYNGLKDVSINLIYPLRY
ncbi:MAG: hypothetical protein K0R75_1063 [Paenibacillaceae bacterium]|nr:hypothetical protein [Paenibacillaceae bacterium]